METNRTVFGVDTAKRVFQLHGVDTETGEIVDLKLTRGKFLDRFANRAPCPIAMEACGGSQHWARQLRGLGHEVRLLEPDPKRVERFQGFVILFGYEAERSHKCPGPKPPAVSIGATARATQAI